MNPIPGTHEVDRINGLDPWSKVSGYSRQDLNHKKVVCIPLTIFIQIKTIL